MSVSAAAIFYPSRRDRVELARRRYFDEGVLPSGAVSDAVFQSWARCQRLQHQPAGRVAFQPVTPSRAHHALQKNRSLHEAWLQELPQLQALLGATSCAAMLTDATGVLIGATCVGRVHERLMPVATRVGVNLSEEAVGTTAPGVVARTGQPVTVLGSEHYFESVSGMHCTAAPIRDVHGQLAGVLDISSEETPFNFDTTAVVGLYAGAIENRLLIAQSQQHLVLRFQIDPTLLDSPLVGLVGIDMDGKLAWSNGAGARLLGVKPAEQADAGRDLEQVLGTRVGPLASLPVTGAAPLRLPSGLVVWARAQTSTGDGHRRLHPGANFQPSTSPATSLPHTAEEPMARRDSTSASAVSLQESEQDLVARTLEECGGNVSRAAKRLGVSRGLIYRRLRGNSPPAA